MAVQTKEITVGDNTYIIQQFSTEKGLIYLNKLVKLLAPSLAHLIGDNAPSVLTKADGTAVPTETLSGNVLALAAEKLVENMDKVDTVAFIKDLMSNVFYAENSQPIKFSTEFQGNYGALFRIVFEVIKFNYESVFTSGVFNLDALQMKVK